jgi:hypothetical protein
MPSIDNSVCRSLLLVSICCTPAFADAPGSLSAPPSGRETFLAAAIVAMMLLGVTKYALFGRISERTHVAIALLGVLIGLCAAGVVRWLSLPKSARHGDHAPAVGGDVQANEPNRDQLQADRQEVDAAFALRRGIDGLLTAVTFTPGG